MRMNRIGLAASATVLLATFSACGDDSAGSAADFASHLVGESDVDYEPLRSPDEALDKGDVIATGTVVDVLPGVTLDHEALHDESYGDRKDGLTLKDMQFVGQFVTIVIEVDETVGGEKADGRRLYVSYPRFDISGDAVENLAETGDGLRVAVVGEDASRWQPYPDLDGVEMVYPDGMPADAILVYAFIDGFWFQGPGDSEMRGAARPDNLGPAWGSDVDTIDEYVDAIRKAA